jgi:TolB-like protein
MIFDPRRRQTAGLLWRSHETKTFIRRAPHRAGGAFFLRDPLGHPRPTESGLSLDQAIERMGGDIQAKIPQGAKIAVVEFTSESANLSAYLMEDLNIALLNNGLSVIDRANLDAVRQELNFHLSSEVSDESVLAIGRFLGAAYVVTGQFRPAGSNYRLSATIINTESAAREAASRLFVRDDPKTRELIGTKNERIIARHIIAAHSG